MKGELDSQSKIIEETIDVFKNINNLVFFIGRKYNFDATYGNSCHERFFFKELSCFFYIYDKNLSTPY